MILEDIYVELNKCIHPHKTSLLHQVATMVGQDEKRTQRHHLGVVYRSTHTHTKYHAHIQSTGTNIGHNHRLLRTRKTSITVKISLVRVVLLTRSLKRIWTDKNIFHRHNVSEQFKPPALQTGHRNSIPVAIKVNNSLSPISGFRN